MPGIGPWELAVIVIIALVVIGPRKLPDIMRSVGKGVFELRKASTDFRRTLEHEVHQEERDEQHTRVMAERMKYMQQLQAEQEGTGQTPAAADAGPPGGEGAPAEAAAPQDAPEASSATEAAKPIKPT